MWTVDLNGGRLQAAEMAHGLDGQLICSLKRLILLWCIYVQLNVNHVG